jgi:hypothetical protein
MSFIQDGILTRYLKEKNARRTGSYSDINQEIYLILLIVLRHRVQSFFLVFVPFSTVVTLCRFG